MNAHHFVGLARWDGPPWNPPIPFIMDDDEEMFNLVADWRWLTQAHVKEDFGNVKSIKQD